MAKATVHNRPTQSEPRVRRAYFECRYGQLHVHNAMPPGGGFEEGTPLLCVHSIPGSARLFERFLAVGGRDRSVYAPDIPGCGESDPPASRPTIADYAAALGDFLDSMRFRQIDVLGYQAGVLLATELALSRPQQIRRVVMVSVPALNDAERENLRRSWGPVRPGEDGSQLAPEWRRTLEAGGPGFPVEVATRLFADRLRGEAGAAGVWAAAQQYAACERLGLLTQPTLVIHPQDESLESAPRVREWLPKARILELSEHGNTVFDAASDTVMAALKEFLRG